MNPKKIIMPEDIKAIVQTNIVYDYERNQLQDLYENTSFKEHKKKLKIKEDPTLEDTLSIFKSIYYYPSIYEINVMARMLGVNIYITRRKFKHEKVKMSVRIIDVKKNKNMCMLLNQDHDDDRKCDMFEIYFLENNILLHKNQVNEKFWQVVQDNM
jgi:hypothetical protein